MLAGGLNTAGDYIREVEVLSFRNMRFFTTSIDVFHRDANGPTFMEFQGTISLTSRSQCNPAATFGLTNSVFEITDLSDL